MIFKRRRNLPYEVLPLFWALFKIYDKLYIFHKKNKNPNVVNFSDVNHVILKFKGPDHLQKNLFKKNHKSYAMPKK